MSRSALVLQQRTCARWSPRMQAGVMLVRQSSRPRCLVNKPGQADDDTTSAHVCVLFILKTGAAERVRSTWTCLKHLVNYAKYMTHFKRRVALWCSHAARPKTSSSTPRSQVLSKHSCQTGPHHTLTIGTQEKKSIQSLCRPRHVTCLTAPSQRQRSPPAPWPCQSACPHQDMSAGSCRLLR